MFVIENSNLFDTEIMENFECGDDYENLILNCEQTEPFDEVFKIDDYNFDSCCTFQDLRDFFMNEDSLMAQDDDDDDVDFKVHFEVERGELLDNQSSSQTHGLVITNGQSTAEECSGEQTNSQDEQNEQNEKDIAKEKKRLKTNEKARERTQARKQKEKDLQNKEKILKEENSNLLDTINTMKEEKLIALDQLETHANCVCERLCQMAREDRIENEELLRDISFLEQLKEIKPEWVNHIVQRVCYTARKKK